MVNVRLLAIDIGVEQGHWNPAGLAGGVELQVASRLLDPLSEDVGALAELDDSEAERVYQLRLRAPRCEVGTKRIFIYDGEGGAQPFYLSPDIKQAQLILDVINKIINEIYHSVGVAGERTKQDNALGIDNSSGVAKAYDFERVNALLASKADSLEMVENRLVKLVMAWAGETYDEENPMVEYPDNFDVRGLYDEFEIAARLAAIDAPDEVRREQMKLVIDKLFPKLKDDLKKKMLEELKQWPPKLDAMLETMGANSISSESMSGAGKSPAGDTSTNPGQPT